MHKNKEAYNAAYQRAFEGKSSHAVWNFLNSAFQILRQSWAEWRHAREHPGHP